jgi:cytochrome P450
VLKFKAKVVEELEEIFQYDKQRSITYRDLQDMKYLEMVIKEAQRMYPSVPFIGRHLKEDVAYSKYITSSSVTIWLPSILFQITLSYQVV